MFGLLVFFFKLFFSIFFAILFSYFILEEEENNVAIILFSILGLSLSLFTTCSLSENSNLALSILAFSIIYLSFNFFNISHENKKLLFIFPGLIGLLIGIGVIFEVILILGALYIAKNSLNYIYESKTESNNIQESEKNIK